MARDAGPPNTLHDVDEIAIDPENEERLVLGDLLNRVLDKGVVISGHVTISIADVDLIAVDLRVLITSIQTAIARAGIAGAPSGAPTDANVPLLPSDPRERR